MTAPLVGLASVLDRWLLLGTRQAAAEALPQDRRAKTAKLHAAADARVDSALGQRGATALLLARAALPCLLEAVLAARGEEPPPTSSMVEDLWTRYDALAAAGTVPPVPPALAAAREHAITSQLPDDEVAEYGDGRIEETLSLANFLADLVEVRTPGSIRLERLLRIVGVAMLAILVVTAVRGAAPRPANLALHANVTMSSRRPSSGPPLDLTNGKVVPEAGIATNDEPDPWVQIDLGSAARLSEITLMNGDDHQEDLTPLRTETSVDGNAWEPAAVQKTSFSAAEPAVLSFSSRSARYVRIHGRPGGAIYLHEVELR